MKSKILISVDSFKGTLSSAEAGDIIRSAFADNGFTEVSVIPVTDGGDGMNDALLSALDGQAKTVTAEVKGPFFETIKASYLLFGTTAVIECAAACGLTLVARDSLDVMNATTYGVGQLIADALSRGASTVIIGLGGSATNDGGTGMACALGIRFLNPHSFIPVGRTLSDITGIDFSGRNKKLDGVRIVACCDVTNVFCGKNGAARVYAKQKGASAEEIKRLDCGMVHLAELIHDVDLKTLSGSGAAGGLAGGITAFLGGKLCRGFDMMASLTGLEERIRNADTVITGEGRTDTQTADGKLPSGVASLCSRYSKPCILISGSITADGTALEAMGFLRSYACTQNGKTPPDKETARKELYDAALKAAHDCI